MRGEAALPGALAQKAQHCDLHTRHYLGTYSVPAWHKANLPACH
jgi:hypothetical protein